MLPTPIYESLPYVCLIAAIVIAININDPVAYGSGALFYLAGASIWIRRSIFRRNSRLEKHKGRSRIRTQNVRARLHFPEFLYEILPFVYIAAGVAALMLIEGNIAYLFAMLLWSAGGFILFLRSSNRRG